MLPFVLSSWQSLYIVFGLSDHPSIIHGWWRKRFRDYAIQSTEYKISARILLFDPVTMVVIWIVHRQLIKKNANERWSWGVICNSQLKRAFHESTNRRISLCCPSTHRCLLRTPFLSVPLFSNMLLSLFITTIVRSPWGGVQASIL